MGVLLIMGLSGNLVQGQSITNPGFENGTTGWNGCSTEMNPASVYGGPNSSMVAEVDGHDNPSSTTDDRILCQTITGLTVGAVYALEFEATRRQTGPTPASVSVTVAIDNVLSRVVTRTGAWNMVRERYTFAPTSTTHTLRITPNFTGSHGMLFDNFNLVVASPLPIELVAFNAWPLPGAVHLEWSTASEQDNAGFTVERSIDMDHWGAVAEVPGAGNSQQLLRYAATDERPLPGSAYYRLKQTDLDGTTDYSEVRHVVCKDRDDLHLWPNPAGSLVHVNMDAPGKVQVLDANGRSVQVFQEAHSSGTLLHIAHLPVGLYQVRSVEPGAPTVRFIKE